MELKNIISITEARSKIFSIVERISKYGSEYVLTKEGKPEAVLLSVKRFDELKNKLLNYSVNRASTEFLLQDKGKNQYANSGQNSGVIIIRDAKEIIYLGKKSTDNYKKEKELVKAQLYIELVDVYNYPIEFLEIGKYLAVGKKSFNNFCEADIVASDNAIDSKIIFLVSPFGNFENEKNLKIEELFSLAEALSYDKKKPSFLVYFSRSYKKGEKKEKILTINYSKFDSLEKWEKAGRPVSNTIPKFK